ncbi:hypothetical protein [Nitrolancea hollandica]|uniref:Uncharacterized protein n=1 Tax=Nitrolancea hollandica Lb TaxID=1129897 RepID=I4EHF4_9BACT|nr:hypothetical protein [Nitrolancea hollandica]CCF84116.1 hypothetical protein NITHO_310009 [Nitrolancea hollandica Lb]
MTDAELQAEELTVLPQRLETIFIGSGGVSQSSNIHQSNFNNQIGGTCFHASCGQFNSQSNVANVHQHVSERFNVHGFHHHRY